MHDNRSFNMEKAMAYNKILIVTGGSIDDSLLNKSIKTGGYSYVFGVDKGLEALCRLGIKPDMAVGDFDSSSADIRKQYEHENHTRILNPMKDLTDTHAALIEAMKRNPCEIDIIGATGSRMDHVLGNIALLKISLMHGIRAHIIDGNNKITMTDGNYKISKADCYGTYVSLIPYSDKVTGINTRGFLYELKDAVLVKEETIGISNELREEEGLISIEDGYLLVLETND